MVASLPLRVGLIGYGIGGAVFHAPLIDANPQLRLTAVVTRNPERRNEIHAQYPDTQVVADASELLDRAGELDLVVVASPNRTHVEMTEAALEAGLPVVVDKPFTPSVSEATELIDHARARDLMLTVFQNRRWDNDMLTVRKLIDEGELGAVHRFESRFERWVPTPKPGWREKGGPDEAGGVLYDLGSHLIDQALMLFGPVSTVYAEIDWRRPEVEVDDDAFVALTHENGVRSHLWVGKFAAQHGPRFRLLGDRAAYTKFGLDPQENELREGKRPAENWGVESRERWGLLGSEGEVRPLATVPGNYPAFYDGVVAALRDGTPPPVDPADASAGLRIIEAARRSAHDRTVERLG
ncbi:Gfo/Idh/MocA family protein [Parasphingorhabdus pacifica]